MDSSLGPEKGAKMMCDFDDEIESIYTSYDPSGKAHPEESMDAPNGVSKDRQGSGITCDTLVYIDIVYYIMFKKL